MTASGLVDEKLLAMRQAFDRSFAEAAAAEPPPQLDFLTIRISGDPYALRLSEISSLHADRKLVAAPSLLPELLGVSGFRSVLTPIYELGPLLGYAPEPAARWLAVARSPLPIGFAFGGFDTHLRVPLACVSASEPGANAALRGAVQVGASALPLLHLPSLVEAIAQRIKALGPSQER